MSFCYPELDVSCSDSERLQLGDWTCDFVSNAAAALAAPASDNKEVGGPGIEVGAEERTRKRQFG